MELSLIRFPDSSVHGLRDLFAKLGWAGFCRELKIASSNLGYRPTLRFMTQAMGRQKTS
jgi:hypothetical protein